MNQVKIQTASTYLYHSTLVLKTSIQRKVNDMIRTLILTQNNVFSLASLKYPNAKANVKQEKREEQTHK